ncbi:RNA polymerase sigma factor [Mangrovibacterium marinum]|uniref:RNA polymerase sigma-70 factor (ECF subfamily) n=1 Tax=Mangrovibacterium marinum TaxID=1639118 RepID=A0A2T5C543_9BACT|nr:sigma-70 family RNA polymerase sigma factor [Mangrovibacterium marinum]PTN09960.1 RNA polymerase sigma-70 factor (ECF subfamily) [Mangrovibacterium marinum]
MLASEFKTKVLPLSSKLMRFASQLLHDQDQAQDIIQDVFLKLWQKKDQLAQVENMEAFAMRMTRNRCLDLFKAKKPVLAQDDFMKQKAVASSDLQQQIELSESALLVRQIIRDLPDIQRTVMHLRDIEQYEYDEIAQMTDLTVNAIRVNLSRARKKVRDELIKQNDGK